MKLKRNLTALILFSAVLTCRAQDELRLNSTWKDSAKVYIRELKNGAIAVRLQTRSMAINQLNKMGNYHDAEIISKQQREENLEIVEAFRSSFKFCKVYFFVTDSTDAWLSGKRSGYFLNDSLEIDRSVNMNEKFFLVAEKGNPHIQIPYDKTQPDIEQTEPSYANETIVLRDRSLRLLKDPFPYYAQEPFPQNLTTSNWKAKVQSLDKKLNAFYRKSTK